ncbi:hypothetical protein BC936DRAFT_146611 [Jimgerdemannia flammicorona]|uniref:Sedlin n=1 Tax=Jimgerdemannia flammicorona TaxID=994334 RepID=A0A433D798_9FUNG|nr:hypothetical protein BC936DRAFT_146611 [Jimgerdemannia flammicorona]
MGSSFYLVIVGSRDDPVYEADLGPSSKAPPVPEGTKKEESKHLNQFIIHSALDIVEEVQWNTTATYLKVVDKFNEFLISAFVSAGS